MLVREHAKRSGQRSRFPGEASEPCHPAELDGSASRGLLPGALIEEWHDGSSNPQHVGLAVGRARTMRTGPPRSESRADEDIHGEWLRQGLAPVPPDSELEACIPLPWLVPRRALRRAMGARDTIRVPREGSSGGRERTGLIDRVLDGESPVSGSLGGMSTLRSYPSRVDAWLVAVLGSAALGSLALGVYLWQNTPAGVGDLLVLGLPWLIVAPLGWPVRYELGDEVLVARSGVLRFRVPLASIEAVTPSREPWSSPALSLDRLRIDRRRANGISPIWISPRDREGFLADLAARAAGLHREEDRLERRKS
jgi:hypothetical protein